ncbi:hypothetical protein AAMO2058_000811900 [Amorphochlora amoebiformis]
MAPAPVVLCLILLVVVVIGYAWVGSEPIRWVKMATALFRTRYAVRRFVRRKWTMADAFEERVDTTPYQTAMIFQGKEMTYFELDCLANRIAAWAGQQNLKPGHVVALLMGNRPEFIAIWLGLSKVGVVSALLNTNLKGDSLKHCLQTAKSKVVITDSELVPLVEPQATSLSLPIFHLTPAPTKYSKDEKKTPLGQTGGASTPLGPILEKYAQTRPSATRRKREGGPTNVLFYIYTSGTTGLPKAAKISHARFYAAGVAFGIFNQIQPSDRVYTCLPLYHSSGGMIGVSLCWYTGATQIVSPKFSASRFFQECRDNRATVVQYIGQICRYLNATPESIHDRSHAVVKGIGNGMRIDTWREFQSRFGIEYIGEFYAATEGNAALINNQSKLGAVGYVPPIADYIPFINYPLRIIKIDSKTNQPVRRKGKGGAVGLCVECAYGEAGELISRIGNDSVDRRFDGYLDARATRKKILENAFKPGDRWFRTGDLLRRDSLGYYYFVDRIGDTYRWGGENIAASEVQSVLASSPCPKVVDVTVYGVEVSGYDGKAGMACLQFEKKECVGELTRLYNHCWTHLPKYAVPIFLRIRQGELSMDLTTTFKHKKTGLQREGFNPAMARGDLLYVRCKNKGWMRVDEQVYESILDGRMRL